MICPKCGHERCVNDDPAIPETQCPSCGIIYAKFKTDEAKAKVLQARAEEARQNREADRERKRSRNKRIIDFLVRWRWVAFGLILIGLAMLYRLLWPIYFLLAIGWLSNYSKSKVKTKSAQKRGNIVAAPLEHDPDAPGLELSIKYGDGERRIRAFGLGRFNRSHYIVSHCHLRNERRTFKLSRIRMCVDAETGEVISRVKDYILDFNPNIIDLTSEFEAIEQKRMQEMES